MAPKQCPSCARFLRNDLVLSLTEGDQPCPGCGEALTADAFGLTAAGPDDSVGTAPDERGSGDVSGSARGETSKPVGQETSKPVGQETSKSAGQDTSEPTGDETTESAGDATTEPAGDSVRPPDLPPAEVRDDASDVLEGWDRGATPEEIASWNADAAPFPTDTVAVLAGGTIGALVGALLRGHRVRGAVFGGLAGLLGVASARRIWRSPDDRG